MAVGDLSYTNDHLVFPRVFSHAGPLFSLRCSAAFPFLVCRAMMPALQLVNHGSIGKVTVESARGPGREKSRSPLRLGGRPDAEQARLQATWQERAVAEKERADALQARVEAAEAQVAVQDRELRYVQAALSATREREGNMKNALEKLVERMWPRLPEYARRIVRDAGCGPDEDDVEEDVDEEVDESAERREDVPAPREPPPTNDHE